MERKVLNVGGNSKSIKIPPCYSQWTHHLLDIDPGSKPDILCDARNLQEIAARSYDSVYCSHNLEHYFSHDVPRVLHGFNHVLKDDGFIFIAVPDVIEVMRRVVNQGLDIEDTLYTSGVGPISVKDVLYGFGQQIEHSGCDFFAHKTGFSLKSLLSILHSCGFIHAYYLLGNLEICVVAFRNPPNKSASDLLNLADFNNANESSTDKPVPTSVYWHGGNQLGFVSSLG